MFLLHFFLRGIDDFEFVPNEIIQTRQKRYVVVDFGEPPYVFHTRRFLQTIRLRHTIYRRQNGSAIVAVVVVVAVENLNIWMSYN